MNRAVITTRSPDYYEDGREWNDYCHIFLYCVILKLLHRIKNKHYIMNSGLSILFRSLAGEESMDNEERLLEIILHYREELQKKIREREKEMQQDNNEHYLVYHALGFTSKEGYQIDYQQNVGRFLYNYAGSLLEELTIKCMQTVHPDAEIKVKLPNTIDKNPKKVEIDCLIGNKAYEIKWKDATTDGDHIKKEHKRVQIIKEAGYVPVRIMFFEPNRKQAIKEQKKLKKMYEEIGGEYYSGEDAWRYLKHETGIDLKKLLQKMRE